MTSDADLPDHVRRNRAVWNGWAADYVERGRRAERWVVVEVEGIGVLANEIRRSST